MPKLTEKQEQAVTTIDRDIAVSAGAGSGKTRVLVERFLHILQEAGAAAVSSGDPAAAVGCTDILAITFTKKAATEMRAKIRKNINKKMSEAKISGNEMETSFWQERMAELSRAPIGTIHSLCTSVLRAFPVEAGIDPGFAVAEQEEQMEFFKREIRNSVRACLQEESDEGDSFAEDVKILCDEYGAVRLCNMAEELFQGEVPEASDNLSGQYEDYLMHIFPEKLAAFVALSDFFAENLPLKKKKAKWEATILDNIKGLNSVFGEFVNLIYASETYNRKVWDDSIIPFLQNSEVKAKLKLLASMRLGMKNFKEECREFKEIAQEILNVRFEKKALDLGPFWQSFLIKLYSNLLEKRKLAGTIFFDDLETLTLQLLQKNASVREKMQEKYAYIMVDEFQDTNDRQKRLIYLLAGGDEEKLRGRKLFVVGDPKQSIYRFRNADVSVFAGVQEDIKKAGGCCITLEDNFRSAKSVIDCCDALCEPLIGSGPAEGEREASAVVYEAQRANRENNCKAEIRRLIYGDKDANSERAKQVEAVMIVNCIRNLHAPAGENEEVLSEHDKARGFKYGEISILLQKLTKIAVLTDALEEAGIPFSVVDGRGFYERQEIIDLLNVLEISCNPDNDLALNGFLRSCYCGIDDENLTRLNLMIDASEKNKSLWRVLQNEDAVNSLPDKKQVELLQAGIRKVGILSGEGVLLNLPEYCALLDKLLDPATVLMQYKDGKGRLANYEKFLSIAGKYNSAGRGTLRFFRDSLQKLREEGSKEAAATVDEEDAVTIMTIHKSKGLEFPVVILPFLEDRMAVDRNTILFNRAKPGEMGGFGIKVADENKKLHETRILERMKEENHLKEKEEKARLLYVAITRAEEHLVLIGAEKRKDSGEAYDSESCMKDIISTVSCLEAEKEIVCIHEHEEDGQESVSKESEAEESETEEEKREEKEPILVFKQYPAFNLKDYNLLEYEDFYVSGKKDEKKSFTDEENALNSRDFEEENEESKAKDGKDENTGKDENIANDENTGNEVNKENEAIVTEEMEKALADIAPLPEYGSYNITGFTASSLQGYCYCQRRYFYEFLEKIVPFSPEDIEADDGVYGDDTVSFSEKSSESYVPAVTVGSIVHKYLELTALVRLNEYLPVVNSEEAEEEEEDKLTNSETAEKDKLINSQEAAEDKLINSQEAAEGADLINEEIFAEAVYDVERKEEVNSACEKEARKLLAEYLSSQLYAELAAKQIAAEWDFVGVELLDGTSFKGQVDAVSELDDGTLAVIDYKTGKAPETDADVSKGYAWQLAIYVAAVERLYKRKVSFASLHFLRGCTEWKLPQEYFSKTQGHLSERSAEELGLICNEIKNKKTEEEFSTASYLSLCDRCPFEYMCRKEQK